MATRSETSRIRPLLRAARKAVRPRPRAFPASAPPDQVFSFRVRGIALELPRAALMPDLWQALTEGWYE